VSDLKSLPNRRDRRRERTRSALIEAGRRVFADRGVEGATIQQITDTADVAKGSFYNHFASHDEILRAVVADTLGQLGQHLDRALAADGRDPAIVVAQSLRATLRACLGDPVLGAFLLRGAEAVDLAVAVLGERGRRDLATGVASGRFQVADVELTATMIAGAAVAVLRKRLRAELPPSADARFVAAVLRLLGLSDDEAQAIASESGNEGNG